MMLRAFSLLDSKVGTFSSPFYATHVGHAVRMCTDLANDRNTTVGRYPSDFMLFEIGTFDDQTGALSSINPISHGSVQAFIGVPHEDDQRQSVIPFRSAN